ncbi:hypothetical protein Y1Q_0003235 [Alligator mississippiensis]|uniref:Uncharacterized protein n=1 Tax=Alligator mississippiensis TaxID=8496 RepID=A0A151MDY0_ALLMI|nr:hypothetical protein Y1Q_0003235 [Alligator mississippiensis]
MKEQENPVTSLVLNQLHPPLRAGPTDSGLLHHFAGSSQLTTRFLRCQRGSGRRMFILVSDCTHVMGTDLGHWVHLPCPPSPEAECRGEAPVDNRDALSRWRSWITESFSLPSLYLTRKASTKVSWNMDCVDTWRIIQLSSEVVNFCLLNCLGSPILLQSLLQYYLRVPGEAWHKMQPV